MFIELIKIKNNSFPGSQVLKKNFEIECSAVNLLVGNQGCGKSTMLTLLQKNHSDLELKLSEDCLKNGVDSFYFDTEKDNPRLKDPLLFTNADGTNKGIGFANSIAARFQSHGEILEIYTVEALLKAKNCVVIIDEPESGLSITNQFRLIEAINKAVDNGCQLFIATHCYPLIESFNVISLEHWKKMSGKKFITKVKNGLLKKNK